MTSTVGVQYATAVPNSDAQLAEARTQVRQQLCEAPGGPCDSTFASVATTILDGDVAQPPPQLPTQLSPSEE
eukprot:SAG31_NODE_21054_length_559_cov_0.580435_2_plen_71_part_01